MGKILLYYKYVDIQYPEQVRKWQHRLCESLGLKGRIVIAHEGVNGTVGGSEESTVAYVQAMREHPLFSDVDFKESPGGAESFPRLRIVIRPEIVHLGLDTQKITSKDGGQHLTPEQTHQLLQNKPENLVLLDGRNWYESNIGTFTGAITPNTKTFREFPAYVDEHLDQFKDKQVLMFCTGGIRCERASAYLKSKGVTKEIYQIQGGIHRYIEQYPDGFFRGKNYVFDARITVKANDDILTNCTYCPTPCDDYTNCINASCNKQFTICAACMAHHGSICSDTCRSLVATASVPLRTTTAKISPQGS